LISPTEDRHFANDCRFLEFYGLPPKKATSNADQLQHFGRLMGQAFNVPAMNDRALRRDW